MDRSQMMHRASNLVVHECFNQLHSWKKNLTMWIGVGKLINSLATQVIKGDEKEEKKQANKILRGSVEIFPYILGEFSPSL